jgi:hypothetical protein
MFQMFLSCQPYCMAVQSKVQTAGDHWQLIAGLEAIVLLNIFVSWVADRRVQKPHDTNLRRTNHDERP